jgi:hypothetical protein
MAAMLHLTDADSGTRVPVTQAAGSRLLRLCVDLSGSGRPGYGDLRVLVVADVLRRVAEVLHAAQAVVALAVPGGSGGLGDLALGPMSGALQIPGPEVVAESVGAAAMLLGGADVVIGPVGRVGHRDQAGIRLAVGAVEVSEDVPDPSDALHRRASAVRLALLTEAYAQPVSLTRASLDHAEAWLGSARRDVAAWSLLPSAPIPHQVAASIGEACDDDLSVPALLGLMRDLMADPAIADGAKLESALFADRILALDLAGGLADVGL